MTTAEKQKVYRVSALVTVSVHAEVPARNRREAMAKASTLNMPSLCAQCAGGRDPESWQFSELDGLPMQVDADGGR